MIAILDRSTLQVESLAAPVLAKATIAFSTFPYPANTQDPVFLGIKPSPPSHEVYAPTDPVILLPPTSAGILDFDSPYRLGPDSEPVSKRLALSLHQANFSDLATYYAPYLEGSGKGWFIIKNPEKPIFLKVCETDTATKVIRVKATTLADLGHLQLV